MDDTENFVISYETLFDLLKREKERADLQKLDENFFKRLIEFLKEKKEILKNPSLDSFADKKNTERELDNIKKLLIDLYGKREKKIIGLALDKSRTKLTIVDNSTLLEEEKKFFNALIELFDNYREGILFNVLNGNLPFITEKKEEDKIGAKEKDNIKKNTKIIRFIYAVPTFVGEELEEYGPFEEEDVANLPIEIADLLIAKGRAEEIKDN